MTGTKARRIGLLVLAASVVALGVLVWTLVPSEVWSTAGQVLRYFAMYEACVLVSGVLDWREAVLKNESRLHAWGSAHATLIRRLFSRVKWTVEVGRATVAQFSKPRPTAPTPAASQVLAVDRQGVIEAVPAGRPSTDLVRAA